MGISKEFFIKMLDQQTCMWNRLLPVLNVCVIVIFLMICGVMIYQQVIIAGILRGIQKQQDMTVHFWETSPVRTVTVYRNAAGGN